MIRRPADRTYAGRFLDTASGAPYNNGRFRTITSEKGREPS